MEYIGKIGHYRYYECGYCLRILVISGLTGNSHWLRPETGFVDTPASGKPNTRGGFMKSFIKGDTLYLEGV